LYGGVVHELQMNNTWWWNVGWRVMAVDSKHSEE